jgi:hypothetical protein
MRFLQLNPNILVSQRLLIQLFAAERRFGMQCAYK